MPQAMGACHRSGFLLEVEKKWLGGNTVLLQALKTKWAAR
jgi:hypothetical protein